MVPTLRPADLVLIRSRGRIRPGDVVTARFRDLPDRLVIKRAGAEQDGGWLIYSDNEFAPGDSQRHGVADVEGRALIKIVKGVPRRIPTRPSPDQLRSEA